MTEKIPGKEITRYMCVRTFSTFLAMMLAGAVTSIAQEAWREKFLECFHLAQQGWKSPESCYSALSLAKKDQAPIEIAATLHNLGTVLHQAGEEDKAEKVMLEALQLFERIEGDHEEAVAMSLRVIGAIYYARREWSLAQKTFERALKMWEKRPSLVDDEVSLGIANDLGLVYGKENRRDEAEASFARAVAIGKASKQPGIDLFLAIGLGNLGSAQQGLGKQAEATANLLAALAIFERLSDTGYRHQPEIFSNIASIYELLGRTEEAKSAYAKAMIVWENSSDVNQPAFRQFLEGYSAFLKSIKEKKQAAKLEKRMKSIPGAPGGIDVSAFTVDFRQMQK